MEKTDSIKKNYAYNTIYQILSFLIQFVTTPYVSRILGSSGIGVYSYTNSIVSYFMIFAALGTAGYGQREIARHRDDKEDTSRIFWEIELLSVFTTGISVVIWSIWIIISSRYTIYYAVLTLSIISVAFDISWLYAGLEKFGLIVRKNAIVKIVGLLLIFTFVNVRSELLLYVGIMSATGLLGNVSMWTYLPKNIQKISIKRLHPFKLHLKQTFIYFIPTIATSIYSMLDKTMIGAITKSESQNGFYEQATKIVSMAESLLFSLNNVMYARQSYLFSVGKTDEIKDKINKSFEYLTAVSVCFMFGITAGAANFVPWFFGKGYEPVIKLLCMMSPLPLVISISNILGNQVLSPSGQRARSTRGIVAGTLTNVVLNSIMIPWYGAYGAVIASIAAELVISLIYVHMSKDYISWKQIWNIIWKKIAAGIVMALLIGLIGINSHGSVIITLIQLLTGTVIYMGVLIGLKDKFGSYIISEIKKRGKNGKAKP